MDGLGIDPLELGNAVLQAKTPFLDTVWTKAFSTLIHASGIHVGLPDGIAGNSEVGHLNIGSGQVVYQSLPKINDSINSGKFYEHPVILEAFAEAKKRKSNVHIMGILSTGGVHGHTDHLYALLEIAKSQGMSPFIHAFMDGRDTGPEDGYYFLTKLQQKMKEYGVGQLASMSGRLYSMDRDKRWERTTAAYNAMVGYGERKAEDPVKVLQDAYKAEETDQTFKPTTIVNSKGEAVGPIKDNDILIFYNFREDRARQITKAFVLEDYEYMAQEHFPKNIHFVSMTGYEDGLPTHTIFPPHPIEECMARLLSNNGLKQLHMSETEKYMHVTYFFNGGVEEPFDGEDRFNIPSPKVFDYSETPDMSAWIIRDELIYRMERREKFDYKAYIVNLANPDMLGHTGNLKAAIKGVHTTDAVVKEMVEKTVELGGAAVIIADHGNCDIMIERDTGQINTYHTSNPVPFIVVSDPSQLKLEEGEKAIKLGTGDAAKPAGILADVAPTCLAIIGVEPSPSMTGVNLIEVL